MAEQKINTSNQHKVPKLVQLTLPEVEPFNDVISTLTITSSRIEKKIAELFSSIFEDFDGCKIVQNSINEPLKCKLYFKPCMNKGEGLYAVKVRGEDIKNKRHVSSFSAMVNTVNMLAVSKQFELEDMAKEILADFVYASDVKFEDRYNEELNKVVKIRMPKNWNPFLEEVSDVIANKYQTPYLAVNVDLTLLIAKLYGKKDPDEVKALQGRGMLPKDRYQYSVSIVKILNPSMRSYILEIKRMDIKALEELSQSIGYGAVTGSIVMTRA